MPLVIGTFSHQGHLSLRIESVWASEGAFVIPVSPEPRLAVTQGASNLPRSPHTHHPGKERIRLVGILAPARWTSQCV